MSDVESEVEESIEIPMERLSPDILTALVDEFILREGTDYGHSELSLEEKRTRVIGQLKSGRALIAFSTLTQDTTILRKS